MELQINGKTYEVHADADTPLLWVIRDELGMTGTKYGCGIVQCGACSLLIDGVVTRSCVTPVEGMTVRQITTIEAIETDHVGKRVVAAWVEHQVPKCGYCQSGQVMAATSLLKQNANPTDEEIAAAIVMERMDAVRDSGFLHWRAAPPLWSVKTRPPSMFR
jgi:isoquinoline 1-oxidoreductase subunit alpha